MFSMQQFLSSELVHTQEACRDCGPFSQVLSPYNSQEGFVGSKSPRKHFLLLHHDPVGVYPSPTLMFASTS